MFKFTGSFHKLDLDITRAGKEVREAILVQFRQAMRAFIRAAVERVPVYSGMSRGALRKAAKELRGSVGVPITPVPAARKKHPRKNAEAGERLTTFSISQEGFQTFVEFSIGVEHYFINEFLAAHPSQRHLKAALPWNSFNAGRRAFRDYLEANLQRKIPKITSFFERTEVKF